jgi:hypothetical protein
MNQREQIAFDLVTADTPSYIRTGRGGRGLPGKPVERRGEGSVE